MPSLEFLCAPNFRDIKGLLHGYFTRAGGVSSGACEYLNVGYSVGDEAERVEENHRRVAMRLSIPFESLRSISNVHGNRIVVIDKGDETAGVGVADRGDLEDADGMIITRAGVFALLKSADCALIMAVDPVKKIVGLFHAGWPGVAKEILPKGIMQMQELGCCVGDIELAIGPMIQECCYHLWPHEVEVRRCAALEGFINPVAGKRYSIDLMGAIKKQAVASGIALERFTQVGGCTCCQPERFFSNYRARRTPTGRMAAVIGFEA